MLNEPDIRDVTVYIYGLVDPRDLSLRYVGKSANPRLRVNYHASEGGGLRTYHWIWTLRVLGFEPLLQTLRVMPPGEDAAAAEREEIAGAASRGCPLLNTFGAPGLPKPLNRNNIGPLHFEIAGLGHREVQRWIAQRRSA
jgi:hypothetical protein